VSPEIVLQDGDCGSWVVDTETDEVYGHVVAADDFGEAQVIPFNETLRDMRLQLSAASVKIPTPEDIRNWQRRWCRQSIPQSRETPSSYVGLRPSRYGRLSSPHRDAQAIKADEPPTMIADGIGDTAHPRSREEDSEAPNVSIERPATSKDSALDRLLAFEKDVLLPRTPPTDSGYSSLQASPTPSTANSPKRPEGPPSLQPPFYLKRSERRMGPEEQIIPISSENFRIFPRRNPLRPRLKFAGSDSDDEEQVPKHR
jgi:hypothetical protein